MDTVFSNPAGTIGVFCVSSYSRPFAVPPPSKQDKKMVIKIQVLVYLAYSLSFLRDFQLLVNCYTLTLFFYYFNTTQIVDLCNALISEFIERLSSMYIVTLLSHTTHQHGHILNFAVIYNFKPIIISDACIPVYAHNVISFQFTFFDAQT